RRGSDNVATIITRNTNLEQATAEAEQISRYEAAQLTDPSAGWRNRAPSTSQLTMAKKWGITVPAKATSGQVSDLIALRIERWARWKAGQRTAAHATTT